MVEGSLQSGGTEESLQRKLEYTEHQNTCMNLTEISPVCYVGGKQESDGKSLRILAVPKEKWKGFLLP